MIILDACILISFGNAGYLHLIDELQHDSVCVSARARLEVIRDPARSAMDASIGAGRLSVTSIDLYDAAEQSALQQYDARAAFRGRGDAEVLALATARGFTVASDELAIRKVVISQLGPARIAGTADLVVWAVREGRISLDLGEDALKGLDSGAAVLAELQRRGETLKDLV